LDIVTAAAEWFDGYTADISDDQARDMMHTETGGMMELFADLYAITGNPKHLTLMKRYERRELFDLLEQQGADPLVNMHANTTVPEIHGAARAYEVTEDERYKKLVERYWEIAVDELGTFATGGQTSGEIWAPRGRHAARLGSMNQEHCVVYNMMRLADYLFRWTGEAKYADYWERNLYNGIFAQGFWRDGRSDGTGRGPESKTEYVAYYLPLHANAVKVWGSATGDFWCCHNTLLQANASFRQALFHFNEEENRVYITQYQEACVSLCIGEANVTLSVCDTAQPPDGVQILPENREVPGRPCECRFFIRIGSEKPVCFTLCLRRPWWVSREPHITVNGEAWPAAVGVDGFMAVERLWSQDDEVTVMLPKAITVSPLSGQPEMAAFLDGPVLLAGLGVGERTLYYRGKPEEILAPYDERHWGEWQKGWKTVGQEENFVFMPIFLIGHENYTTYFPVKQR